VAFVPPTRSSTRKVRAMLPGTVPFADAAANAGRASLLPTALTSTPDLLLAATEDRLHQRYRAPAMPASAALVDTLRADGIPAVISGAGPTVLALVMQDRAEAVSARCPGGWSALRLGVEQHGARVIGPD
jgi:homoserine kinase